MVKFKRIFLCTVFMVTMWLFTANIDTNLDTDSFNNSYYQNNGQINDLNKPLPSLSAPGALLYGNTSHIVGVWSSNNTLTVNWVASNDPVDGYRFEIDHLTTTIVPENLEGGNVVINQFIFTSLTTGAWYIHIKSFDETDGEYSWSSQTNYGPFLIDLTEPVLPSTISSPDILNTTWSNLSSFNITWDDPIDDSGISGYNYDLSTNPLIFLSSTIIENSTNIRFEVSSSGIYYFYLKSQDYVGNWNSITKKYNFQFWIDQDLPDVANNLISTWQVSTWNSSSEIIVSWDEAFDTGGSDIDGYSIKWSQQENDLPDAIVTHEENELTSAYTFTSDGSWWCHIRSKDNAGNWDDEEIKIGPFFVDLEAPTNPSFNTYNLDNNWNAIGGNTLEIAWSGESDGSGSGVTKYYYLIDQNSNTLPTISNYFTLNSLISIPNIDDGKWYFHLRAADAVGWLASNAIHHEFWVDVNGPNQIESWVANVTTSIWTVNNSIQINWTEPTDIGIGLIGGYAITWSNSASSIPNKTSYVNTTELTNISYDLSDGEWWFHIQTFDTLGFFAADSNVTHIGPFYIDVSAPTNPTIEDYSPILNSWINTDQIYVIWDDSASDGFGSGISGYCLILSTSPSEPTIETMNLTQRYYTFTDLSSGKYYIYLKTQDIFGHWATNWITLNEFWLDNEAPISPQWNLESSSPLLNSWSNQISIYQEWFPADLGQGSEIAGYCITLDLDSGDPLNIPINNESLFNHNFSIATTGTYYLHLAAVDSLNHWSSWTTIGPFLIDLTAPLFLNLTSGSFNASISNPTNQSWISAQWSGFYSDQGSGIQGFAWIWDLNNNTIPDSSLDWQGTGTNCIYNSLVSTESLYFHIKVQDNVGNWSIVQHYGPFFIDRGIPQNPSSFVSTNHPLGSTWSINDHFVISWSGMVDNMCDIDESYYSWIISTSPNWNPVDISSNTFYSNGNHFINAYLTESSDTYYFHIIMRDKAGNWNLTASTYGPFKYDHDDPICPDTLIYTNATETWMDATQINIEWNLGSDIGSGINRYRYIWSSNPLADPTLSSYTTSNPYINATYGDIGQYFANGINYLIICVEDNAGRKSIGVFNMDRTFNIDTLAPEWPVNYYQNFNITANGDLWDKNTWDFNCSSSNFMTINWMTVLESFEDGCGIAGYSININHNALGFTSTNINCTNTSVTVGPFADGINWYVHINLVDNLGRTTSGVITYGPLYIDTLIPSEVSLIDSTPDTNQWSILSPVTIVINQVDVSDIGSGRLGYSYVFSTNPSPIVDDILDVYSINNNLTFSGLMETGTYYFSIKAIDRAGNWGPASVVGVFNLDFSNPTAPTEVILNVELETWVNNNDIEFNILGATDPEGIQSIFGYHILLSSSDSLNAYNPGNIVNYTTNHFLISNIPDGEYYIFIWSYDGNSSLYATPFHRSSEYYSVGPIKIDTVKPTDPLNFYINCSTTGWNRQTSINFNWSGQSDSGSGILGYCVIFTHESSINLAPELRSVNFTLPSATIEDISDGQYYIYVYTKDQAGNWANEYYRSAILSFDGQPPQTEIQLSGSISSSSTIFISQVDISLITTNEGAGLEGTRYRINNNSWQFYYDQFSIFQEGSYIIQYYSTDSVGNNETINSIEFDIDLTNPIFTSALISIGDQITFNSNEIILFEIDLRDENTVEYVLMELNLNSAPSASLILINSYNISQKNELGYFVYSLNTNNLTLGEYIVNFKAVEDSGRYSELRGALTFTISDNGTSTTSSQSSFLSLDNWILWVLIGGILLTFGIIVGVSRKKKNQVEHSPKKKTTKNIKTPYLGSKTIGTSSVIIQPQQASVGWKNEERKEQLKKLIAQKQNEKIQSIHLHSPENLDHYDQINAFKPNIPSQSEDLSLYCAECKKPMKVNSISFNIGLKKCPICQSDRMLVYFCDKCNQYFSVSIEDYYNSQDKKIKCLNCSQKLHPANF